MKIFSYKLIGRGFEIGASPRPPPPYKHDKESTTLWARSSRNGAFVAEIKKVTKKSDQKVEIGRFKFQPAPSIEELFQNLAPIT